MLLFLNGVRVALERHELLQNRIMPSITIACLREMLGSFTGMETDVTGNN